MMDGQPNLDTSQIKEWRSIVTLIVFVVTNIIVLFPFHIPIPIPRVLWEGILDSLGAARIISRRQHSPEDGVEPNENHKRRCSLFRMPAVWFRFPMNFVTAPLIADLFLLAILAIGREEVRGGTLGSDNIHPIEIMAFFLTLAYIAISIDASGIIRFLAFKVLQKGGGNGHRLYCYLYTFFFALASFIGNDPIVLSGTAFLAYMTRVSANIKHPRAWIHTQFTVANIGSAILVSSNPTNLVLAGAFGITFIEYTINMIVPVIITAIALLPFLLFIVFWDQRLVPSKIEIHELPESARGKRPINPNIPNVRGTIELEDSTALNEEEDKQLSLEEIMNPFLDKSGAFFGSIVMATALVAILVENAITSSQQHKEYPVYYVTLPAAFIMLCWDLASGWKNREETRRIAREGRERLENAKIEKREREQSNPVQGDLGGLAADEAEPKVLDPQQLAPDAEDNKGTVNTTTDSGRTDEEKVPVDASNGISEIDNNDETPSPHTGSDIPLSEGVKDLESADQEPNPARQVDSRPTLTSICTERYKWAQETFPTVMAVLSHLPLPLIPFALSMFVLVQALVTRGWVPVFAYGWSHWVSKTGTIGAIGGMAFLAVMLCNFAGTNIGTTILLCRIIQAWEEIHKQNHEHISQRTFWATVYSLALGVNYGAFSTAFSASLAGLLWRDILGRKFIHVGSFEFARINLPIITYCMTIGCTILIGEVYITRSDAPYKILPLNSVS